MILRGYKRPPEVPEDQDLNLSSWLQPIFLIPPAQCPHQREENLTSFLHTQNPPLPLALVDPAISRGKIGKQERNGPGAASLSGAAVESRPFAQKMPSMSSMVSVGRAEVLGGVGHHEAKVSAEE